MEKSVEYQTQITDWSKHTMLSEDQRNQLIQEKLERWKLQSEQIYSLVQHARDYEQ